LSPRREKGKGRAVETRKKRSITPPPSIAADDLQYAYKLTQSVPQQIRIELLLDSNSIYSEMIYGADPLHAVGGSTYEDVNPVLEDEDEEEDPELKAIMESARQKFQSPGPRSPSGTSRPALANVSTSFSSDPRSPDLNVVSPALPSQEHGQVDPDCLKLKVFWQGPPLASGQSKWTFRFHLVGTSHYLQSS
jgi:hypothetical protein